jgi:UDP-N-acetylglucosamine--dolichyl-phosphate N-acetylglucosaminephosphotransferase
MENLLVVFVASFIATWFVTPKLISKLSAARIRIVGRDMNKPDHPEVPEMGGLAVIAGFVAGVLLAIALATFQVIDVKLNLAYLLAGLSTVLIMALIGIFDDLLVMRQSVKAALPLLASLPLVAIKLGDTHMTFPFLGEINFGLLFPLLLIPLAITGASNATNMLAGFNGLEAGLGVVMTAAVGIAALALGRVEAAVISLAMLGALLAFLRYNWHPAKILIGDVGTLTIGTVVAVSVIVGNIEKVGIILILPFVAELILKARSKFKAQSWCETHGHRLYCPKKKEIYGLGRLVMHVSNGITEQNLVLTLIGIEAVFAVFALAALAYGIL